jgi:hypothetical protein
MVASRRAQRFSKLSLIRLDQYKSLHARGKPARTHRSKRISASSFDSRMRRIGTIGSRTAANPNLAMPHDAKLPAWRGGACGHQDANELAS